MDDMFFYVYWCCIKKHGITNDIPSIPSDEEDEVELDGDVEQGNDLGAREGSTTTGRED